MSTRMLRGMTVTVLATFALLLGAGSAMAHARLLSTDPADGSSLAAGPQQVSLTFSDTLSPEFTTITVVGPDNKHYESGAVTANGGTVSIGVLPLGPAGRYEIGYRVVSDDGHPVAGSVAFTLTTAGPGAGTASSAAAEPSTSPAAEPAPAAAAPAGEDSGGGTPVWPWIVGAVVLVGGGVIAALRLGR